MGRLHVPRSEEILREHARAMHCKGFTFGQGLISVDELEEMFNIYEEWPCANCGRSDAFLVPQGEYLLCIDCATQENGEDGDG